ncbi:hypothetical protein PtrSN002B_008701 [Pyrenophora tritici-repentis]|uniref:Uncharacterized protein n=2 Tax=Pyrenophora tritici-repentis TaxID=45151 RepID=A0A2W1DB34_9PLEO|nr:uncharacterized protein PTRG_03773 [Pyrenophora tritici-repentis Pt-1C-BFP]KAA8620175.1 hypothetical protein PtrV1_07269 [Pyrenophora tritici-repentis]EDU46611.1 conserved hypothetical protein [Pyrenophora tritici-repentis Pt-1C-BFP]KAF7448327.1 hypothetical protein A1F99_076910 [Pyrenophora tritici-repentis]KAF7572043.1 hypothetical protein PtrM4_095430 [Pyrenophora tritici-repentis]KAG9384773.1 hypothetical protein A1F94_004320 [Pyrenophora tritici-repentis]
MSPAIRLSTVEFRSLLLPPIRISLKSLQTFHRPQYAVCAARPSQCVEQRRALNLYKTARSLTVLGQHKVLTFDRYDVQKASPREDSTHRINLYEAKKNLNDHKLIAENISLKTLYNKHMRDGQLLYCLKGMEKKTIPKIRADPEIIEEYRNMALLKSHTHSVPIKHATAMNKFNNLGPLKVVIFTIASPPDYVRMCMDRAYQFLENGCPVEMRIRMQNSKLTKEERIRAGDPEVWPWVHARFPHLRPDFILKSMPAGAYYLVDPVSDGRIVQWVMAMPTKNQTKTEYTKRLFTVKRSVEMSIEKGQQAMLPKVMRQQLMETGNLNYSQNTGLPKVQARMKYASGGDVTYGGEEKKWLARDAETDKFLVPDTEEALQQPLIRYEPVTVPKEGSEPWRHRRGKTRRH